MIIDMGARGNELSSCKIWGYILKNEKAVKHLEHWGGDL